MSLQKTTKEITLSANGTFAGAVEYLVSATPSKGIYTIFFELEKDGTRLAQSVAYFEIPETEIVVSLTSEPAFYTNTNNLVYTITHKKGIDPAEGTLCVELIDPTNSTVYVSTKNFTIDINQSTDIMYTIPFRELKFGNYKLVATVSYEGKTAKLVNILPCSIDMTLDFDRTFYRIREELKIGISETVEGRWQLKNLKTITEIPTLSFMREEIATVLPCNDIAGTSPATTTYTYTIPIPETLPSGTYSVNIKAILPDEQGNYNESLSRYVAMSLSFTVPPADLEIIGINKDTYTAGETGFIRVQNTGGVDGNSTRSNRIGLSWRKPEGTVATSRMVRKTGSPPKDAADGQTVYEGIEDNYTDTEMQDDVNYYYAIFPSITTDKKVYITNITVK
ncbi:MAG: hypothetical protein AB1349_10860 [Elusimicrobiota bacterium]